MSHVVCLFGIGRLIVVDGIGYKQSLMMCVYPHYPTLEYLTLTKTGRLIAPTSTNKKC